jgi:hypothetical protein
VFSLKDGTKRQQQSGNTSYGTGALLAKRVSCSKTLFSSASSQFLDIHLFLRLTPPPKQTIFSCKLSNPGHYRFTILIPRESVFFSPFGAFTVFCLGPISCLVTAKAKNSQKSGLGWRKSLIQ